MLKLNRHFLLLELDPALLKLEQYLKYLTEFSNLQIHPPPNHKHSHLYEPLNPTDERNWCLIE